MKFSFRYRDVKGLMDREPYYPEEVKARVLDIVMEQRRRYAVCGIFQECLKSTLRTFRRRGTDSVVQSTQISNIERID